MNSIVDLNKKYKRKNSLIRLKLLEYIPILVISNLSTLLIITVDGLVVGNFVGSEALAAIQIFYPVTILLGAFTAIISNGTAQRLSEGIVKNDYENLKFIKAAIKRVIILSIVVVGIIQIPIVFLILKSYNLEHGIYEMTRNYAIGVMIATPFSIISAVSVCQLQIAGKVKILMVFAIIEGTLNLILDILFVKHLKMGVVGASLGSASACTVRALLTLYYLYKRTKIHNYTDVKVRFEDVKSIVLSGLPEASSILSNAFQNYVIIRILLLAFTGSSGGTIKGVCAFCASLVGVAISSLQGAMRPLLSVMVGSDDKKGMHNSMRIAFRNVFIAVGIISIAMQVKPEIFFHIHGIKDIPEYGVLSLRLYTTYFIYYGFNTIFRLYFVNRKDAKFATRLTLIGNLTMPVFAYLLYKFFAPPYVWLCYLFTTLVVFVASIIRYIYFVKKDRKELLEHEEILYLTVNPHEAIEASKDIDDYIIDKGFPRDLANDLSLCMEEMVNYAVKSQKYLGIHIQIIVKLSDKEAKFVMLDDGICIKLNENKEQQNESLDNYEVIKKLADSYDYQYLLNMNYTTLNFLHRDKLTQ